MGHRAGAALLPFAAVGALLLHRTPSSAAVALIVAGVALHVAMMFLWSIAFVWIVEWAHYRSLGAALLIGFGQFVVSWVVAWSTGDGLASVLALGDRLVFALVLVIALVVGMRFTFLPPQDA